MKRLQLTPPGYLTVTFLLFVMIASTPSHVAAAGPGDSPTPAASTPREVRFGAVKAYEAPGRATEAGVAWERVIIRWDQIQPNGPSDWKSSPWFPESALERELADGRKVVAVVLGTPSWLSGTDPNAAPPNLGLPFDAPDNYWGQFMRRLAAEYRGRVDDWIIWNEPDVWNNSSGLQQWNGSVEQYYQLVKVAYQAVKSVNPNGRIILAGLTYWWDQQFGREQYFHRFLNVASHDPTARANGFYFDAASLHLYGNPQDLYAVPLKFKRIMQEYELDKPIWINETNVVPWDDSGIKLGKDSYRATMDEQASYLIQAFASALAAGVERIEVYKMSDDPGVPGAEPYGLVRSDPGNSTRAAFEAFQVITGYMSGVKTARIYHQGTAKVVRMERQGDWVTVLWNLSPAQIQLPLTARTSVATLVDKFGHTRPIYPKDGKYYLDLAGATADTIPDQPHQYHIGGSPLLLVEEKRLAVAAPPVHQDWSGPGVDPNQSWVSPVTGYAVSGDWLAYYRKLGGEGVLGQPIGRVVLDPAGTNQFVQYFQNGVLEWHPENPPEYRVERRLLGNLLYPWYYEPPVDPQDARQRPRGDVTYFPNQPGSGLGHYVANYAPDGSPTHFKEYFDRHGGADTFGYPKEEPKLRNGRWTQRFQAAVFECQPMGTQLTVAVATGGATADTVVQLEPLGQEVLNGLELPLDW